MRDEFVMHRMAREAKILKDDPIVQQMQLVPIHMGDDTVLVRKPSVVQEQLAIAANIKKARTPPVRKRFLAGLIAACVIGAVFAHNASATECPIANGINGDGDCNGNGVDTVRVDFQDNPVAIVFSACSVYEPTDSEFEASCNFDNTDAYDPPFVTGQAEAVGITSPHYMMLPSEFSACVLTDIVHDTVPVGHDSYYIWCPAPDRIFQNGFEKPTDCD